MEYVNHTAPPIAERTVQVDGSETAAWTDLASRLDIRWTGGMLDVSTQNYDPSLTFNFAIAGSSQGHTTTPFVQ
jgi:hypothetical protein